MCRKEHQTTLLLFQKSRLASSEPEVAILNLPQSLRFSSFGERVEASGRQFEGIAFESAHGAQPVSMKQAENKSINVFINHTF